MPWRQCNSTLWTAYVRQCSVRNPKVRKTLDPLAMASFDAEPSGWAQVGYDMTAQHRDSCYHVPEERLSSLTEYPEDPSCTDSKSSSTDVGYINSIEPSQEQAYNRIKSEYLHAPLALDAEDHKTDETLSQVCDAEAGHHLMTETAEPYEGPAGEPEPFYKLAPVEFPAPLSICKRMSASGPNDTTGQNMPEFAATISRTIVAQPTRNTVGTFVAWNPAFANTGFGKVEEQNRPKTYTVYNPAYQRYVTPVGVAETAGSTGYVAYHPTRTVLAPDVEDRRPNWTQIQNIELSQVLQSGYQARRRRRTSRSLNPGRRSSSSSEESSNDATQSISTTETEISDTPDALPTTRAEDPSTAKVSTPGKTPLIGPVPKHRRRQRPHSQPNPTLTTATITTAAAATATPSPADADSPHIRRVAGHRRLHSRPYTYHAGAGVISRERLDAPLPKVPFDMAREMMDNGPATVDSSSSSSSSPPFARRPLGMLEFRPACPGASGPGAGAPFGPDDVRCHQQQQHVAAVPFGPDDVGTCRVRTQVLEVPGADGEGEEEAGLGSGGRKTPRTPRSPFQWLQEFLPETFSEMGVPVARKGGNAVVGWLSKVGKRLSGRNERGNETRKDDDEEED